MSASTLDEDHQLGELLVELSLLTRAQLADVRSTLPRDRTPPLLARDLFERGLLSPIRLLDALRGRAVPLRCHPCSRLETAEAWSPDRPVACPGCGAPMRVPGLPPGLIGKVGSAATQRLPAADSRARDTHAAQTLHRPAHAAATPLPLPGTAFGRYRLLDRLGEGGMGVVWKALDTELDRVVALKQIRGDGSEGPDTVQRFQREARLAAALRHPGIVAVHDVGEIEGKPYLTMDYVEGRTFEDFLDETRAARKAGARPDPARFRREVAILAAIADAVAYAHEHGVIHRDLKHGNVLLDRDDRPYVMDFGLAREVGLPDEPASASGTRARRTLTMDGQTLGTPMFMSPEQARGHRDEVGVASDVWSLGVMLYDLLAGETPFERPGTPWEIMMAVVKEEPVAPRARNAHAPRELEAVALKALEKPQERRYRSAREFAEELRRWLRGDPVAARQHGAVYRLWRRVVRHPRIAALAVAVVLALAGAGGLAWRERAESAAHAREAEAARRAAEEARTRERAKQAALVAQLRNVSDLALTAVLELRRRGIVGREARFVAALERAFEEVRVQAPELAEPWFHRGRLLRALHRTAEALTAQEEALARDSRFAPALYERAVLALHLHQARVTDAYLAAMAAIGERRRAAGEAARGEDLTLIEVEREDEELRRWKEIAHGSLARLREELQRDPSWAASPEELLRVGEAKIECVAGMISLCGDGTPEETRARLERALNLDPGLEEAFDALYYTARGAKDWATAEAACTRGLEHDLGWLPFWENRGIARMSLAGKPETSLEDRARGFAAAIDDFDRALAIDPRRVESLLHRGGARANWAQWGALPFERIEELNRAAIADFDALLALDPARVQALAFRGNAHLGLALGLRQAGRDPAPEFAAARADYDRAIERLPGYFMPWNLRGFLRSAEAANRPPDERERALLEAEADLGRAVALHAGTGVSWSYRGQVRLQLGDLRVASGRDPAEAWTGAVADLFQVVNLDERSFDGWLHVGGACEKFALWRAGRGEDHQRLLEQAVGAFKHAAKVAPRHPQPVLDLAGFWLNYGNHLAERGPGPAQADAAYLRAIQLFGQAIDLAPADPAGWQARALTHRNRGFVLARAGGDAQDDYRAARADLARAAALGADPTAVQKLLDQMEEGK